MTKVYHATVPAIKPALLDARAYAAIGRLVRSCSDIEDYLTLYICRLMNLSESKGRVLLGQMPVSAKVKVAERAAQLNGIEEEQVFAEWFDVEEFLGIFQARNAVAHGILLGVTDADEFVFRTSTVLSLDTKSSSWESLAFSSEMLENRADAANIGLENMPVALGLQTLLQKRQRLILGPHPKSQPKKKRSGGLLSRPSPSQE